MPPKNTRVSHNAQHFIHDEKILAMRNNRISFSDISQELGIPISSIKTRYYKMVSRRGVRRERAASKIKDVRGHSFAVYQVSVVDKYGRSMLVSLPRVTMDYPIPKVETKHGYQ